MIELYRKEYKNPHTKKSQLYDFFYYTIVVDGEPAFEIELTAHNEVHVISDGSTFNLGKGYRKVKFEKSDLVKFGNERDIIWQYFGRIGEWNYGIYIMMNMETPFTYL